MLEGRVVMLQMWGKGRHVGCVWGKGRDVCVVGFV